MPKALAGFFAIAVARTVGEMPRLTTPSENAAWTQLWMPLMPPQTSNTFSIFWPRISLYFSSGAQGEWSEAMPEKVPSTT